MTETRSTHKIAYSSQDDGQILLSMPDGGGDMRLIQVNIPHMAAKCCFR